MTWTDQNLWELAAIFAVAPDRAEITKHPLDPELEMARLSFLRGVGVAAAIASFLNREIYKPNAISGIDDLHYTTNLFAFVENAATLPQLCITLRTPPRDFLEALRQRQPDIRYVALHPELLPEMRASGSFDRARTRLQTLEA